ncbi:MAG: hypothetical protein ACKV2V_29315, partial [Blastocatellia bacterium]
RPDQGILHAFPRVFPRLGRGSALAPFWLFPLFLLLVSCKSLVSVSDKTVPRLEPPVVNRDFAELIASLKPFTDLGAQRASRVTMQFIDTQAGERVRWAADATLVLQRPDKIRLLIQAPTIGTRIADMLSLDNQFRIAIFWPDKYRRFLTGTNTADYSQMRSRLAPEEQQSAFINARPFHFTDALLPRPLSMNDARFTYGFEETLQEEADTRKEAGKGARVLRSYYVISEIELPASPGAPARTKRRFWFERAGKGMLARQQLFDERGQVATEVSYSGYMKLTEKNDDSTVWPATVLISRPRDGYAARLTFTPGRVEMNPDLSEARPFVLENTENLPVTDLDKK